MAGNALTPWDERLAALAKEYADTEQVSGGFISTRGGLLSFEDEPLPGNQMLVVVLDAIRERTFYAEKFDANREHNAPPICYAFGRTDDEMAPHPSMQADLTYFQPQNDVCATCPNNEWGTADTGKGKACGERRRLALLPAGYFQPKPRSRDFDMVMFEDEEHYQSADIAYLKLPTTSVKHWARYVTTLASQYRRPPTAVVTRVYIEPDPKHQFHVKFEMVAELPSEMLPTIMQRHEEAVASVVFGYAPPSAEVREGAAAARRGIRR